MYISYWSPLEIAEFTLKLQLQTTMPRWVLVFQILSLSSETKLNVIRSQFYLKIRTCSLMYQITKVTLIFSLLLITSQPKLHLVVLNFFQKNSNLTTQWLCVLMTESSGMRKLVITSFVDWRTLRLQRPLLWPKNIWLIQWKLSKIINTQCGSTITITLTLIWIQMN